VKRDMELVRDILFAVEASEEIPHGWINLEVPERTEVETSYHVVLMAEAGLIEAQNLSSSSGYLVMPKRLTWHGHEFLDATREPEVWRRTKEGAAKVGNSSLEFLWELAKSYAKQRIKERLGLDLG
jgi:uncharacterized protein DUF2513